MSKKQKLIEKLKSNSAFTWPELESLMNQLEFEKVEGDGSRVKFVKAQLVIMLHKPHPQNEIKNYVRKAILEGLKDELL